MSFSVSRIYALIIVFLLSQTAGLVHAEIHPFHDHDHHFGHSHDHNHESFPEAVCDAFGLVENQSANDAEPPELVATVYLSSMSFETPIESVLLDFEALFQTRAPPVVSL